MNRKLFWKTPVALMTSYSRIWAEFTKGNQYASCVKTLSEKGMVQPYIDNILRTAFDAGYNSNRYKKLTP
jgi:hypothetical protein